MNVKRIRFSGLLGLKRHQMGRRFSDKGLQNSGIFGEVRKDYPLLDTRGVNIIF